jgi:DnaJ domain
MPGNYRLLPGIGSDSEIEVRSKLTYNPPSDTDSDDKTSRHLLEPSADESDNEADKKSNKKASKRLLKPSRKAHYESVDESDKETGKKSNNKARKEIESSSATSGLFGGTTASSRNANTQDDDVPMRNGVESEGEVTRIRDCRENDYYNILNVKESCSEKQLKDAYIKLSLLTHPDNNKIRGAKKAFNSELIHPSSLTMFIIEV